MSNTAKTIHIFHSESTVSGVGNELNILPEMSVVNVDFSGTSTGISISFEGKVTKDTEWKLVQGVDISTIDLHNTITTLPSGTTATVIYNGGQIL